MIGILLGHVLPDVRHAGATASRDGLRRRFYDHLILESPAKLESILRPGFHLVINAEGAIHHGAGGWLIEAAEKGLRAGCQVLVTNAVLDSITEEQARALRGAKLQVREQASLNYAQSLGIPAAIVRDSIRLANWHPRPCRRFAGKVVVGCGHRDVAGDYFERLYKSIKMPKARYTMKHAAPEWRHLVENLRAARLFITGRFHGLLAAWIAGCPVAAIEAANSHKIIGQLADSFCPSFPMGELPLGKCLSREWARACRIDAEGFGFYKPAEP